MKERVKQLIFVLLGLVLTSVGLHLLDIHQLTFGGTAGLATVLTFLTPWSWAVLFFFVNLPFFLMSVKELGKWFTLSSFMSITAISVIRDGLTLLPTVEMLPWLAAIVAGILIGVGVTFVLNNGSSLGGIHILALYIDHRWGVNRGWTIFVSDLLIVLSAAFLVGWNLALLSVVTIFLASSIIGRYKKSPIKADAASTYQAAVSPGSDLKTPAK
ncbi:YitT family protein [Halalkalibacter oceani]|uniref:YitT family protein n=1 Tax=Halalkalibacter oceani TaxID=1653776 RepID=UPI003391DE0A